MPTSILGLCDLHLSERKPSGRKDPDYIETQFGKLRHVWSLAKGFNWHGETLKADAVVIAGDIWHHASGKRISHAFVGRVIEEFKKAPCPIYVIPGNHDMEFNRLEDLESHPFGVLVKAGVVQMVLWPRYAEVGTDPKVLVTGKEYTLDGPVRWLTALRESEVLRKLKNDIQVESGCSVKVYGLTHCFWGPGDSTHQGMEPIVGHLNVANTGIDVMLAGHAHVDNGVVQVQSATGHHHVVEPGAMMRGSISTVDIDRKPKLALSVFRESGEVETITVVIPHQEFGEVFEVERHQDKKQTLVKDEKFISSLKGLNITRKSLFEVLDQVQEQGTSPEVVGKARQLLLLAEAEV